MTEKTTAQMVQALDDKFEGFAEFYNSTPDSPNVSIGDGYRPYEYTVHLSGAFKLEIHKDDLCSLEIENLENGESIAFSYKTLKRCIAKPYKYFIEGGNDL